VPKNQQGFIAKPEILYPSPSLIAGWLIAYSSRIVPFVFALLLAFRLQRTTPTLVCSSP
jgi:hypothetical protein